jgi:hypothetical protein
MSPLVKTKCQANFKDFKRFGAFKELVEQKNVINSLVCQLGFFGTRDPNLKMDIFGEMTDMLQAYFECGKNTQAAIRLYHQRFLNRTVPHYKKL